VPQREQIAAPDGRLAPQVVQFISCAPTMTHYSDECITSGARGTWMMRLGTVDIHESQSWWRCPMDAGSCDGKVDDISEFSIATIGLNTPV